MVMYMQIEIDKTQNVTSIANVSDHDLFIYAIPVKPKRRMDLLFVIGPREFKIYEGLDFDETKYYFTFNKRT